MTLSQSFHPWPLPKRSWSIRMVWEDLLFAHWPVPAEQVRALLPRGLTLDLFEGEAWIGVVPFRMNETRFRRLPPAPGAGSFLELNVRTYVRAGHQPGVWFFSLDASSRLAVRGARSFFHLPYFDAAMRCKERKGWLHYESRRTHRQAAPAEFHSRFRPVEKVFRSAAGSLESWLTDRYCLYAEDRKERLYRGEIHHAPWPLQRAEGEFTTNRMTDWLGIQRPETPPHLLFAKRLEVVAWTLDAVNGN